MLRDLRLEQWDRELRMIHAQHCGEGSVIERVASIGLALLTDRECLLEDFSGVDALEESRSR